MALLNTDTLSSAWNQRRQQMRVERLQEYADILYDALAMEFRDTRGDIAASLRTAIATARDKSDLHTTLWTFHSSLYRQPWADIAYTPDYYKMDNYLRRRGYEWFVGPLKETAPRMTASVINDSAAWDACWLRQPVSVYSVFKHTDIAPRLARLFGENSFRVSVELAATKRITAPLGVSVRKYNVVLHYYPEGLPAALREQEQKLADKYGDLLPPLTRHVYVATSTRPFIWKGVEEEPGFSNETPRMRADSDTDSLPPLIRTDPPPLERRHGAGEARVHVYEGADAMQRAARDTLSSILNEATPCHCGYHCEE